MLMLELIKGILKVVIAMNKDNKLPTLGEFIAEEVKKYQLGVDYKFNEQHGFKTYTIISEKLQKSIEEFQRQKHGNFPVNFGGGKPITIDFGKVDNFFAPEIPTIKD